VGLSSITVHGAPAGARFATEQALAAGNRVCRELTALPANMLTPGTYRRRLRDLAKAEGWQFAELDTTRLSRMGAGAFMAVARGSHQADAAIVHLTYDGRPVRAGRRTGRSVALVGKGICFDTGGHNLKKDTSMDTMHTDMSGSAAAVGALLAASRLGLPVRIDAWLAIAQNHLSPEAYTQNEVVTALDGTTIETTHTDAEGRMVLADTLTLASRATPDEIIDFATLTGAMWTALGSRQSGVLSNRDDFAARAVAAGAVTGERVVAFPMPADYDESLESAVADVKQCVLESGAADHILAARFLQRFVNDVPWLHVDLSAVIHKGGLGAVGTDITGFGVALALELISSPSAQR
jgi:leucyl aminopeptidase